MKPVVVDKYNQSMNGVDLADQYTVYYSFVRRSKKWWRKVCFWLLEVATVNAYILYKKSNSSHTHLQFRRAVIESLASLHLQEAPERHRGRPFARHLSDTSAKLHVCLFSSQSSSLCWLRSAKADKTPPPNH